jgi:hypothetical protein
MCCLKSISSLKKTTHTLSHTNTHAHTHTHTHARALSHTNTHTVAQRNKALETQMREIETAIRHFSRDKVFVSL